MGTPYALSSDLVSAYPAKSLAIAQYIDGYKLDTGPVQNAQTGTTYTFVLTDTTKTVTANNAAASAYTVPPQSSVVWEDYTTLRLLNLGAGVVTLTAGAGVTINGTATVAQYSSATLVRTASNTWTVAGSGVAPGLALVATATASASSTVSINNCFTSLYDNYRVLIRVIGSTLALPTIRLRVGGADASGANYDYQYLQASGSTASAARTTGATSIEIATLNSNDYSWLILDIANPQAAATTQFSVTSEQYTSAPIVGHYMGRHSLSTSYDGFTILANTGTITTATNGIRVYGYKNS